MALTCTLFALVLGCAEGRPADVVLIVLDTTRADRLGVYGHTRPVSPELDRFAADAVVFRNAWATASWTLPSHASLLTGKYPSAHGAHMAEHLGVDADSKGDRPAHLPEELVTLAELLAPLGHRSAAVAGAGWLAPEFGLLQGYEVQDAEDFRTLPADQITDRALAWLETVPADQPVHLLVNYFDPHWPYTPPAGFDLFSGEGPPPAAATKMGIVEPPSGATRAALLDLYDGEIRFMDHHVGRLFRGLREHGRFDGALIVVVADHGELFGEHGASGHGAWLYEEVLRVPMIVRLPGGRGAGRHVDTPVSLVDILPMAAEELDLPVPEDVDGRNPLAEPSASRLILAEEFPSALFKRVPGLDRDLVAGIVWPVKIIEDSRGERVLYRLDEDPGELAPQRDPRLEGELRIVLDELRAGLKEPATAGAPRRMSPEARAQLEALGYLE